jgi:hypothetical protein
MALGQTVKGLAGDEPCATCRLNPMLWERCVAMAFIL